MTTSTVKESRLGLMGADTKVFIRKAKKTVKGYILGKMEAITTEHGKITK
jgi:hypothetical protein